MRSFIHSLCTYWMSIICQTLSDSLVMYQWTKQTVQWIFTFLSLPFDCTSLSHFHPDPLFFSPKCLKNVLIFPASTSPLSIHSTTHWYLHTHPPFYLNCSLSDHHDFITSKPVNGSPLFKTFNSLVSMTLTFPSSSFSPPFPLPTIQMLINLRD